MTAAARRIAALRARALHPATPPTEAQVCRERLAAISAKGPVWVAVDAVPGMRIDIAGIEIVTGVTA